MAGGHGSTPATWTGVGIVIIGFIVGALGMILGPNWLLFWIGAALVPVGALVGRLMNAMGLGESHPPRI